MTRFRFNGISGRIDQYGFVLFGGMGFHREDITGPLRAYLDANYPTI